jgi:serine/threonine protein kinase
MNAAESTDEIAMSLPWSAPEVVSMQTLGTRASDVFSLGATLYSLLAGRTPFESEDSRQNAPDKLRARIIKCIYTPIPGGGVPRIVEELLNKAMFRDPNYRFANMQEFAMALNEVQASLQFQATRLTISPKTIKRENETQEKYPCGHPKVSTDGIGGVVVDIPGSRNNGREGQIDPDKCPICTATPPVQSKPKFKPSPLFWILSGAGVLGFVLGYILLSSSGV